MSTLRLCLLGPPRIERDGVPLDLTYRKNAALLAYLAVTGERHTREALVTLLWPELEPSRARAGLRRNLSVLRKALGGEVLVVDRETVGLDPRAALWLDVDQFRRLLSAWRGHGHPETEVCPACLAVLSEAVALYRGDFLAGFSLRDSLSFDEWQFFETEELRRELGSALERLVRGHSAQGGYESALPYARRWLALDPLHEPAHRHLMQLYVQTGQCAAALRQYQECVRILDAELGILPSRETTSLYERLRAQPAGQDATLISAPPPQHNLPAQTTPFVGREALLAEIAERLQDPDCRLLSLVGPGGIGKTRLALETAREQVGRFEDGVYWVSLAPVRSIEEIVSAVAHAIGLALYRASDPRQRLLETLHPKQMLLVLDNLEHLLDVEHPPGRGAGDLANEILQTAPKVQLVITSRARLNVQGEYLFPVAGMEVPAANSKIGAWGIGELGSTDRREAGEYSAVRLFLSTARRVRPGFKPTAGELADVAQICRLVQGMPLAILLASAWMEILSPAEIVTELEQGFGFLESDWCDLPERQRSMQAVFDASWRMLDDAEREAFAKLSVFRGGFTRDAAQEVAGPGLRMLMSLVHKSLLQRDASGRYEIHELLRQYAAHKLAEAPDKEERTVDLHCRHYATVLCRGLEGIDQSKGTWGLLLEMDNIQAGWRWAVSQARVAEICRYVDLFHVHCEQGWYQEAISSLEWAAGVLRMHCARQASAESGVALGPVLIYEGYMYQAHDPSQQIELRDSLVEEGVSILRRLGAWRELARYASWVAYAYSPKRHAEAWQVVQESIAFCREQGDLTGVSNLLPVLGELAIRRGAYDEAERYCQEALCLGAQIDNPGAGNYASFDLAKIGYHRGEYRIARQFYEDALAHAETGGHRNHLGMYSTFLGDTALAMGDYDAARDCYRRTWALYKEMTVYWGEVASGEHYGVAYSLNRLGDIALALGDVDRASGYYRQALQIARDHPQVALYLDVLVSQAALLAQTGDEERVVELASLALHHPASHVEVTQRAQGLLDPLQGELPPDVFVAASERGRARDLAATVEELLAELGG